MIKNNKFNQFFFILKRLKKAHLMKAETIKISNATVVSMCIEP